MKIQPEFPAHRRDDPKRRAELAVYEALAQSDAPGRALYEVRPISTAPQLDYAIWLQGKALIGVQVKGGRRSAEGGNWYLETANGRVLKPSPLTETWDAAMAIHDASGARLHRQTYIIPVLVLPDMEPDPVIEEAAAAHRVHVLWGTDRLVERLQALAKDHRVFSPPTARSIQEEAELVMPGMAEPTAAPPTPPAAHTNGPMPRVLIEKVEIHVHAGGVTDVVDALGHVLDSITPEQD